ncbi:MAG: sigma 54-interacting transcriptional regulator [Bacillota bacterium]|nr:sigma 54-interacting transcriptional regulator [Bacillota bacterium]MDW7684487.1 sigma 54-interacting transcriptional regulator [Bacillota bacterium]
MNKPNPAHSNKLTEIQLEKIIDSIDEAIVGCDKDGFINIYNYANERREKISRKQVLHRHVEEYYDFHGGPSLLLQAMHLKKPILDQYQEYTVRESGVQVEVICSTVPVMDGDELIGAVSVMKDYSKVKKLSKIIMELQSSISQGKRKEGSTTATAKHSLHHIIGNNEELKNTIRWAHKAAENSLPVLIFGETGTGKELLAQGIHNASARKNNPFIAINCAAIPENLLEGILFGTTKGAFTGAVDQAGLFEQASGGTLVLDEINSMSIGLQSKLLRVIQEESVRRVGDARERKIDTRVISISNEDPMQAIEDHQLRSDLYYRIAYITLSVPPLRQRLDDLPLLTEFLIKKYNQQLHLNVEAVSPSLYTLLEQYSWPGNIRELEHVIAAGMSSLNTEDTTINLTDLPPNVKYKLTSVKPTRQADTEDAAMLENIMDDTERRVLEEALQRNGWNVSKTARELGLKRQSLQYRIKKYALEE